MRDLPIADKHDGARRFCCKVGCGVVLLAAIGAPAQEGVRRPATAAELDHLVESKNYEALEAALPGAKLDPTARLYFSGTVADRLAKFREATEALTAALPLLRTTAPHRAALALYALSQDYFMLGQYGAARAVLEEISEHYLQELRQRTARMSRTIAPSSLCWKGLPRRPCQAS